MLNPDKTLLVAVQVAAEAERLGINTALIGAAALAVHGYARGTEDIDLADLVALMLNAGGGTDLADIVQLLARNPKVDLDGIRSAAGPYDHDRRLEKLIAEARQLATGNESGS